tara:strand:- start:299 stop:478 length:180 start_codon:yes stop_codon:yes gene_type:complete
MPMYKVYVSYRERYEVDIKADSKEKAEDIAVNNTDLDLINIGDYDDGLWIDSSNEIEED